MTTTFLFANMEASMKDGSTRSTQTASTLASSLATLTSHSCADDLGALESEEPLEKIQTKPRFHFLNRSLFVEDKASCKISSLPRARHGVTTSNHTNEQSRSSTRSFEDNQSPLPPRKGVARSHSNDLTALKSVSGRNARDAPLERGVRRTKSSNDAPLPIVQPPRGRARHHIHLPCLISSKSKNSNSSKEMPLKRTVSFDRVQVREFQQVLGDNPCQDDGPSLSLGWDYKEKKWVNIERYESKRNSVGGFVYSLRGAASKKDRRPSCSLSPLQRTSRALELGYTIEEILRNRKQVRRVQHQRQQTLREQTQAKSRCASICDPEEFFRAAKAAHGLAH